MSRQPTVRARHDRLIALATEAESLKNMLDSLTLADLRNGDVQTFVFIAMRLENMAKGLSELAGTNVAVASSS